MLKNRIIRCEVSTLVEGRWTIDCILDDEEKAVAHAEELLASDKYEAVKVERERAMFSGFATVKPIFEQQRGELPKKKEVTLSTAPEHVAWCETLEDFCADASRRAIGQLLRSYLDRTVLTPTELLHDFRHFKKLDAAGNLAGAAVHKIAALQAAERHVEAKERAKVLHGLLAQQTGRARDALASRGLPKLGDEGLAALIAEAKRKTPNASEADFVIRLALTRYLDGTRSFGEKLDKLLPLVVEGLDAHALALVDGLLADVLGSASLVIELLGRQPHLGGALMTLTLVATGRHDGKVAGAMPAFEQLNRLIVTQGMPACRAVLLDRLRREIAGDRPLTRGDSFAQSAIFNGLVDKLKDHRGALIGGAGMAEAIVSRSRRLQIVGGAVEIRFTSPEPAARLDQLLKLERDVLGDVPKRVIVAHILDTLDRLNGAAVDFLTLKSRIEGTAFAGPAKQAIVERLQRFAGDQNMI